jgi:putative transcriptional regulator
MAEDALTGRLLVATPQIEEGVFHRSVILVLDHGAGGAQGVVLTRPLEAEVDAVLPGWQELASAPPRVFHGGPVQTDSALGLVSVPGEGEAPLGIRRLFGRVGVLDLDAPPPLVASEVAALRIFAGYAGWSPGQLEGEVRSGSWYVVDAEARDAFTEDPDGLWVRVLRRQRDALAFVSTYPPDPSLN